MQTIRVINVLWMRYGTSERQFFHEAHVWDLCPIPIVAKTRPAKDVGKRKQRTRLNSMYTLFDQAQPAPKQMYDKQHGKAKGTISGQASVRTIQHNTTAKTWSVIFKKQRHCGRKEKQGQTREDWSAKRVGKQQQVTVLSLMHNQKVFNQRTAQYEGQHGTEKGTILRRTSLKTSKVKQNDVKETRQQRWHVRSEVIKKQNLTRDLSLHGWQLLRPRIQPSLW